jgi:HK97 family phage prohead protease
VPYYIQDDHPDCTGWATVKEDGEVMGCHTTKQDAIDQGLAIALAEGSTFEGERSLEEILEDAPGGGLPENYRPATSEDVPEGRACGNCIFFNEERLNDEGEAWCEWWEAYAAGGNYCNAWRGKESRPYHDDDDEEERQPAPKKEQIVGSDKNEPGSASGPGGDIELSDEVETSLRNKVKEHNDAMKEANKPAHSRATIGQLRAVYRRGAGAFSVSHRPGMTRGQWAIARVNAYLYLLANGKPKSAKYVQDNDLLPKDHPKSTRSLDAEQRQVDLTPPSYMRASARRGLVWHREGLSGDGLVDRTVREARAMAEGNMTADKWVRTRAWIARHLVDMDAPQNTPGDDRYPGPGAVAMALWGGGGSKRSAQRALQYAEGVVDRIEAENEGRNVTGEAKAKLERRQFDAGGFEIREDGDGFRIEGYAALFDSRSENLGGFTETIRRGAFRQSLKSRNNIMFYYNHDSNQVLASTRAGTLRLEEDERGLRVSASIAPTSYGRDAKILVERGDVTGFSFGFSMPARGGDEWNSEGTERVLKSVRLFEVSLVGSPAYSETNGTAMIRGLDRIAQRAEVDADALADALLKIENGEDITTDDRQLIDKVLDQLAPAEETLEVEDTYGKDMLALKKKKLQLLMGT